MARPVTARWRRKMLALSTARDLQVALHPLTIPSAMVEVASKLTKRAQAVVRRALAVRAQASAAELVATATASRRMPTSLCKRRTLCALSAPRQTSEPVGLLCGAPSAGRTPSRVTWGALLRRAPAHLLAVASAALLRAAQVRKQPRGRRLAQVRARVDVRMRLARGGRLGAGARLGVRVRLAVGSQVAARARWVLGAHLVVGMRVL